MHDFLLALIGGAMIGLAATLLMASQGRVMGVSGIVSALLPPYADRSELSWRIAFALGVIVAPILSAGLLGYRPPVEMAVGVPLVLVAGFIVGLGTSLGSGCTSGHGVCGLARMSGRSLAATAIFMVVAIITVFVANLVGG